MRLGIQGPSGSGKTMGALKVAFGLCNDWSKIAVIDSEAASSNLYAHLGHFNTVQLTAPLTPEKYIEAIQLCENSGMEVIIIDSGSHAWEYLLDYHASLPGNSFTNWRKVTPRHVAFINAILQSKCHAILTLRTKTDYVLTEKHGKQVPEKVGMKSIQRDGLDYELTVLLELDIKHNAIASKDRTSLFAGKPEFKLTTGVGNALAAWCDHETSPGQEGEDETLTRIAATETIDELIGIYNQSKPEQQLQFHERFVARRKVLQARANLITQTVNTNKHVVRN
nr:AAA family ATPase [Flavihumibacter sp. UBA7668]